MVKAPGFVRPVDWQAKLRHFLQTLAFCVIVASLEQAFSSRQHFAPSLVYSILIGTTIWLVVDFGREFFPSTAQTGWPQGWPGVLLVAGAIVAGFVVGRPTGTLVCQALGLFPEGRAVHTTEEMRSGMLITLLAGLAGSYWFYTRNKSEYLLGRMREAERHAQEARLKMLETQLEPHMLFNTLANLRALIGVDPPRAQQMLDHMIAYLRATLDASRATTHPLESEFERLRDYLELMKIRMGPRLHYTLDLPPELATVRVPTLVLQPLVENAIQHGLEPKVQGGRIEVRARREGARLLVEVNDTGVGNGSGPSTGKGFGLAQIRDRLRSLHGDGASLQVACDEGGAHACITLPIA